MLSRDISATGACHRRGVDDVDDALIGRAAELLARRTPREAVAVLIARWDLASPRRRERDAYLALADQVITVLGVYRAAGLLGPGPERG